MAIGTLAAGLVGGIVGGVGKGIANKIVGGGSKGGGTAVVAVPSSEGFMSPITDSGSITPAILSSQRGVTRAETTGKDIKVASAMDQGTDAFELARRVQQSLLDQDEENNG